MWDLSSPTRDWTYTTSIGRWSLNHWTSKEIPQPLLLSLLHSVWSPSGIGLSSLSYNLVCPTEISLMMEMLHIGISYYTLQILHFLQIEGLWQSYVKQVCWHHFSNIFSLHSSVKFWQFPWCFECFHYYICYGDLCSGIFDVTIAKRLPFAEGSDDG